MPSRRPGQSGSIMNRASDRSQSPKKEDSQKQIENMRQDTIEHKGVNESVVYCASFPSR